MSGILLEINITTCLIQNVIFYNTVIATFVFGNVNAQPAKTEDCGHMKSSEHILFHAGYSFLS